MKQIIVNPKTPKTKQQSNQVNRKSKFTADVQERIAKKDLLERFGYQVDIDTKGKKGLGAFDVLLINAPTGETLVDRMVIESFLEEKKKDPTDVYFSTNKMLHSSKTQQHKKLVDIKINNDMSEFLRFEGFEVIEKPMRKNCVYSSYYPFVTKQIIYNGIVVYEKGSNYSVEIVDKLFNSTSNSVAISKSEK